jgi:hypothetical protein
MEKLPGGGGRSVRIEDKGKRKQSEKKAGI